MENAGGDYSDMQSSDIVFIIKETEHPFYKRKENKHDLEINIDLTL